MSLLPCRFGSQLASQNFGIRSSFASILTTCIQKRNASHKSQASAMNGSKDGPGKRLGAKKVGGELVVPGVIIYRQRGTKWHPGENVGLGRDHTIFATKKGYVRYYRDPQKHPKRRYIGVVFGKDDTLPISPLAPRRRRLGLQAVTNKPMEEDGSSDGVTETLAKSLQNMSLFDYKLLPVQGTTVAGRFLTMKSDGSFREKLSDVGREMDEAATKIRAWKTNDRWLAYSKRKKAEPRRIESKRKRREDMAARKQRKRQYTARILKAKANTAMKQKA